MAGTDKGFENNELKASEKQAQTTPEQWNTVSLLNNDTSTGKSQTANSDKASKPGSNSSESSLDFGSMTDLYGTQKSSDTKSFGWGDKSDNNKKEQGDTKSEPSEKKEEEGKTKKEQGGHGDTNNETGGKHGDRNKETGDTKSGEKDMPVDPKVQALANDQQLSVEEVTKDGKSQYEFSTTLDGKKQVVFETSESNPEVIKQQLEQAQKDKVAEMEKKYGVDIACDGETTKTIDGKDDLKVTTPKLGELAAVDQALAHSQPDTKTTDGKPLRIVVGDKSWNAFEGGGVRRDDEIVFGHSDDLSHLKEVGVHELAHVGQAQREKAEGYGSYAQELGWVKNPNGDDWLLRGKDGSYWQNTGKKDDNGTDVWMRTDANGNPADSTGKRVDNPLNPFDHGEDNPNVQKISQEEMIGRAAVKPYDNPSDDKVDAYFGNPHEMGAALLTPFRNSREDREKLYQSSADSYQVVKNLDQHQIDAAYGKQENGEPKYIRNPDGFVVENTPENAREVQDFEAKLGK